jgi:hypothetical protein
VGQPGQPARLGRESRKDNRRFESCHPDVDIVVSDFDDTLFKRYEGIIEHNVANVAALGCPVVIVSYRAPDQESFIRETLDGTPLNVVGLVLLGDRKKDPLKKVAAAKYLRQEHNIVAAADDEEPVRDWYNILGIKTL